MAGCKGRFCGPRTRSGTARSAARRDRVGSCGTGAAGSGTTIRLPGNPRVCRKANVQTARRLKAHSIAATSRFMVTFGRSLGGRLTYALGYTGLGVGAARWAGTVVRDMLLDPGSDRLRLEMVRSSPFPFPPEPARTLAVGLVQRELARADAHEGRRGLLLRTLDAIGIGFDS